MGICGVMYVADVYMACGVQQVSNLDDWISQASQLASISTTLGCAGAGAHAGCGCGVRVWRVACSVRVREVIGHGCYAM